MYVLTEVIPSLLNQKEIPVISKNLGGVKRNISSQVISVEVHYMGKNTWTPDHHTHMS